MSEIENRLRDLERAGRRWRLLAIVMFALLLFRMFVGAEAPASFNTISVRRIEVYNDDGQRVGTIGSEDGAGVLALGSRKQKGGVALCGGACTIEGASMPGPTACVINLDGRVVIDMEAINNAGIVGVRSAKGGAGVMLLGDGPDESASVSIADVTGDIRALLTGDDTSGMLSLSTHKGKSSVTARASDADGSGIEIKQPGQPYVTHLQ